MDEVSINLSDLTPLVQFVWVCVFWGVYAEDVELDAANEKKREYENGRNRNFKMREERSTS